MSDTLYLQLDANIEVHHPHVYLQDIAKMSCTSPRLLNRLRVLPVINLDPGKPGRYVMSVMDLIELIRQKQPDLEITPLGETDFILTYEKAAPRHLVIHFLKVAFICLASFFGAAFSIMTFNTDVDTAGLFDQISRQLAGGASQGAQVLKFFYSLGIGVGVVFFFNHFGHGKITQDPTPIEVQMRTYEEDVDKALIAEHDRQESPEKKEGASS